jgi:hypothetical protein
MEQDSDGMSNCKKIEKLKFELIPAGWKVVELKRLTISLLQLKQNGEECNVSEANIKLSLLMYFSYFVLFARFFYKAYVDQRGPRKAIGATPASSTSSATKKIQ